MGSVKLYFNDSNPESVSMTEKSHRNACDINKIVARAEKNGMFPIAGSAPIFADFTGYDFEENAIKVAKAKELFLTLPVSVRNRFENNIGSLLDFLADEKNGDEARKLGLLPRLTAEQLEAKEAAAKLAAVSGQPQGSSPAQG